jgi:hypothetical protein
MATESKEDMPSVVEVPAAVIRRAPPPRWGTPLSPDIGLARRAPLPANFIEQLESLTAVAPMGVPGEEIGAGDLAAPATPADIASFMAERAIEREKRRLERARAWREGKGTRGESLLLPRPPAAKEGRKLRLQKGFDPSDLRIPLNAEQQALAERFLGTDIIKVGINPKNEVTGKEGVFVPQNRRFFKEFIINSYAKYRLKEVPLIPDPDACAKAAEASKKEVKTFAYQSFVRDYMQKPSPYRGVLVYHGLGSGKTCTSIAALEALYQEHQRPIIIMTPASLQPNYRDEITKCGPYIYRLQNHWTWVPVPSLREASSEGELLLKVVGLPRSSIRKRGGGWVPDPAKKPNFDSLTNVQRRQIQEQIVEIMDARFTFINYNGLSSETVRGWACEEGAKKFDGATIVIDEVHNLIRTINNANLEYYYKEEPRNMPDYKPKFCAVAAKKYNKSYLLYRMLCDAVGAKIIALSATPIINFPQEIAILADLLSGDGRMAESTLPIMDATKQAKMAAELKKHPEVDFAELVPRPDGSGNSTLRITPVPSGFTKIINPTSGELRGFKREAVAANNEEVIRERDLEGWWGRVSKAIGLEKRIKPIFTSFTRLPDTADQFKEIFIDTERLEVKDATKFLLMARLSGLISYYKGGKKDLMASAKEEVVYTDMSDQQLKEYTDVRVEEITRERSQSKKKKPGNPSLYEQATKSTSSTFKIFSRAACNFGFPPDMDRPKPADYREARKMLGAKPGASGDAIGDGDGDRSVLDPEGVLLNQVKVEDEVIEEDEVEADPETLAKPAAAAAVAPRMSYEDALTAATAEFRDRGAELFAPGSLKNMSPKFQAIIDRLKLSAGPALVYSNFKTLEGVGLFGLALEAQEGYRKLDIVSEGGKWRLAGDVGAADTPRYITYTGDEDREKRNILLAMFNAKWSKVPGELADEMRRLAGSDNKKGKIARVFMITQSGAEGISLSNVRQVHIMEPYWNYVRLDQVKGRAIRICSHADLPPAERHVDTYIYISRFSAKQIAERRIAESILASDGETTTDQAIWELMKAKKKLADSITDVMKAAAVDCELNATENGGYACYRFKGATMAALYHPLITVDIREGAAAVRALPTAAAAARPAAAAVSLEEVEEEEDEENFAGMPALEDLPAPRNAAGAASAKPAAAVPLAEDSDIENMDEID